MGDRIKVAVLSSGCLNHYEGLRKFRDELFPRLCDIWEKEIELKFFFDFWDFRVISCNYVHAEELKNYFFEPETDYYDSVFPLSEDDKEVFFHEFEPEHLTFHSEERYWKLKKAVDLKGLYRFNIPGTLLREVARSKRDFEQKHGVFDVAFWVRPEICIDLQGNIPYPEPGTVYGRQEWWHQGCEMGFKDLFFYGSSQTIDLVSFTYPGDLTDPVFEDRESTCVEVMFQRSLDREHIKTCRLGKDVEYYVDRIFEEGLWRQMQEEKNEAKS